jgi:hypothetical protein
MEDGITLPSIANGIITNVKVSEKTYLWLQETARLYTLMSTSDIYNAAFFPIVTADISRRRNPTEADLVDFLQRLNPRA